MYKLSSAQLVDKLSFIEDYTQAHNAADAREWMPMPT